jgi:integrase
LEQRSIRITPEKNSNPRILPLSLKLVNMLSNLPKNMNTVFGTNADLMQRNFAKQHKRIAAKLNSRLNQITFHTFRHWKATMEYHKTKDILHVMRLQDHKNIKNTLVYTQLATFEDDDYVCKAAANVKEASELIEAGYEYVCDVDHVKLFRKRK